MARKEIDLVPHLERVADFANAPYVFAPPRKSLKAVIEEIGKRRGENLELAETQDALFVRLVEGDGRAKFLITCHLDHPYMLFDRSGRAVPFGNFSHSRLRENQEIPVKILDPSGKLAGESVLVYRNKSFLDRGARQWPRNYQALYKILPFALKDGILEMAAADDLAMVAVCLLLMENLPKLGSSFDVVFAFESVEEVRQLSGVGISLKRETPWWKIDQNVNTIALEIIDSYLPDKPRRAREALKLPALDPGKGPALRVNDAISVFGQGFSTRNSLEEAFLKVAKELGIKFQYTVQGGYCDASIFSAFLLTPKNVGLTVVDHFRHNEGPDGTFVPERLVYEDLEVAYLWLQGAIEALGRSEIGGDNENYLLSDRLRSSEVFSGANLRAMRRERTRTYRAMEPRLKAEKYYPENIREFTKFILAVAMSYLYV